MLKSPVFFYRLAWWLFLPDDMTVSDRLRLPYWDYREDKDASMPLKDGCRIFSFPITEEKKHVQFAVPEKFFTQDMMDVKLLFFNGCCAP